MDPDMVIDLGQKAMETVVMLSVPILLAALVVGLLVSIFQAATQINEMTLTFVPKLAVVGFVLAVAGPWMLQLLMDFSIQLIDSIPELIR
ncbi:flagellar biosynthesis protein FliQ [Magnetovirga frankeli]|uniref:flagellar biosynthesis protein FliQ n=1 Tax=Magnetovirga frankeli TaxID=947516 RepID=UPI0012937575|nr:flagellar biosynthesis protein FliQ [gamma proteobacterium SS-5]